MTRWLVSNRRLVDPLIAVALVGGYVALLLATAGDLGYARDEGFYYQAATSYARWFELLLDDPSAAVQRVQVDRFWRINHEHPALMKSLSALSLSILHSRWHWFDEAGTALRFAGMLVSSLAVAFTYLWGARVVGRGPAVVGALLLGLMPRVFHHSHLDCFDMPVAALWLVTTYVYWRALSGGGLRWVLLTGVLYGLLLNTKHNSWLLPAALLVHLLLTQHHQLWRQLRRGRVRLLAPLLAMLCLGPLVLYLSWPWIWFDTVDRLREYVAFHMGHEYYNMEFLGQTYYKPPMPRGYAWLMTAATVPAVTLLLLFMGLLESAREVARRGLRSTPGEQSRPSTDALWLLCLLVSYAPWLSTDTPIFGGTKHWLTAYPFLCLFAARGFALVSSRLSARCSPYLPGRLARLGVVGITLAGCVLVGPVVMTAQSHPWGLSAYTPLVGGAPGAANLGLNRTFWGYTTGAVQGFINERVPARGVVYVHDTALQSFALMQRDRRIRQDIRPVLQISASELALYHHEPHMSRVEYQVWVDYGTTAPALVGAYHGVPVIWVYERPR
jgi:4-amino-4-deoxy-L-arabinose transferase-like glycosyltransferase